MNIFDRSIAHLTFTHSDCDDVLHIYLSQMRKHFKAKIDHYIGIDRKPLSPPIDTELIIYDDKKEYPSRLLQCLEALEDRDFIFFDHEDMFLYADPDLAKIGEYYKILKSGQLDHIRLIKGGDCIFNALQSCPTLYKFDLKSKWIFSIQPSLWRRTTLISILKENPEVDIWSLERLSQRVVRRLNLAAAFSYRTGLRRGAHHFDNDVYPYIATALGKGKWNLGEYGKELEPLLREHNIDPTVRGWF